MREGYPRSIDTSRIDRPKRLRSCGVRVALGCQGRVASDKPEVDAMAATADATKVVYELEGTLLEACSCGVLCPCWIGEDPDGGACDAFNAYHFDRGTIGGVDVSGLNFVRVVHIPGNVLTPASWKQVVFIDDARPTSSARRSWTPTTGSSAARSPTSPA